MTKTYATPQEAWDALKGGGDVPAERLLPICEAIADLIDDVTQRTFQPYLETVYYGAQEAVGRHLYLRRDLHTLTSLTVDGVAWVENTSFYLMPLRKPQKRIIEINGYSGCAWAISIDMQNNIAVVGKWGYCDLRQASGATAALTAIDATSLTPSDIAPFQAGQTLLAGSEQLYVRGLGNGVLIVDRGVNGTTAAIIPAATPLEIYRYPPVIRQYAVELAWRELKIMEGGVSDSVGNPTTGERSYAKDMPLGAKTALRRLRPVEL